MQLKHSWALHWGVKCITGELYEYQSTRLWDCNGGLCFDWAGSTRRRRLAVGESLSELSAAVHDAISGCAAHERSGLFRPSQRVRRNTSCFNGCVLHREPDESTNERSEQRAGEKRQGIARAGFHVSKFSPDSIRRAGRYEFKSRSIDRSSEISPETQFCNRFSVFVLMLIHAMSAVPTEHISFSWFRTKSIRCARRPSPFCHLRLGRPFGFQIECSDHSVVNRMVPGLACLRPNSWQRSTRPL